MQNHSMDKSFGFQSVNLDTQVIWMDELKKGFPFVRLYSLLAEGMTIEKKNKNEFFIPYGEAPKFVITSNFSVAGHDDSSLDRQFVIEFFDHYKRKYKPSDEFGHLFFTDWDTEEWNAFYFLMMDYCRYFLSNGLKDYEHVNLNMKKLIDETCNEFADFITKLPFNIERDKKELFEEFLEENESYKEIKYFKQNTFSKWIKKYCQIFDYQLVERKSNKQYLVSINKS